MVISKRTFYSPEDSAMSFLLAFMFSLQEDSVKLQILNLGVKLYLTNPQQTSLLCQYVFTLARYDPNYDVRDRARFLHQFIFPSSGKSTVLSQNARKIFLSTKPAPALESKYKTRNNFQLGSLSHYINMRAAGYNDLPQFPEVAADSSVRNIEGFMHETVPKVSDVAQATGKKTSSATKQKSSKKSTGDKSFVSDSEKSSQYSNSNESSADENDSSSGSSSDDESSSSSDAASEKQPTVKQAANNVESLTKTAAAVKKNDNDATGTSDSESSSTYGGNSNHSNSSSASCSESDTESEPTSDNNDAKKAQKQTSQANNTKSQKEKSVNVQKPAEKSNLDLLLDLDDIPPIGPVMTPSMGGFLTPGEHFV